MHVLLSGIVGSTAYGLAHAGSDLDRLGLFAAPTVALHGLHRPAESHVTTAPDRTLHEAAKWCRLALGCNPTASELVWLPGDLYEIRTPLGDELIAIRRSFLSARAVRNAYLGYAGQQFRKLTTRSRTDPAEAADSADLADAARQVDRTGHVRAAKHARHLVRLLEQGLALHETGELVIRLAEPDRVRALGERYADRPDDAAALLAEAEARFDRPGVLPATPSEAPADAWLRRVRAAHLATAA